MNCKESSGENIVIHIQAFCDGMGLTNPLASASSSHNSTMFYFVIFDLPPSYYADLSHIHLIAMCNSNDLKSENGLDILLNAIVEDLSDLETKGFEIYIPSKGMRRVFVVLSKFTGDNLALNQVFGMTESFSHDFFCPIC
jgi:hypothetical protein